MTATMRFILVLTAVLSVSIAMPGKFSFFSRSETPETVDTTDTGVPHYKDRIFAAIARKPQSEEENQKVTEDIKNMLQELPSAHSPGQDNLLYHFIESAIEHNKPEVFDIMVERIKSFKPEHLVARQGAADAAGKIIPIRDTLLVYAVRHRASKICERLLDKGARPVSIGERNVLLRTAMKNRDKDIAILLESRTCGNEDLTTSEIEKLKSWKKHAQKGGQPRFLRALHR